MATRCSNSGTIYSSFSLAPNPGSFTSSQIAISASTWAALSCVFELTLAYPNLINCPNFESLSFGI